MTRFEVTIVIECETAEQANSVLWNRIGYDEEMTPEEGGPFAYTIDALHDMRDIA